MSVNIGDTLNLAKLSTIHHSELRKSCCGYSLGSIHLGKKKSCCRTPASRHQSIPCLFCSCPRTPTLTYLCNYCGSQDTGMVWPRDQRSPRCDVRHNADCLATKPLPGSAVNSNLQEAYFLQDESGLFLHRCDRLDSCMTRTAGRNSGDIVM